MAEAAVLTPVDTDIPAISRLNVCDRHPTAKAYVVAVFTTGELFLCAHCYTMNEDKIRELTDQIRDERHLLNLPDLSHTGDARNV